MKKRFRSLDLATSLYFKATKVKLPCKLKDQLERASFSIPLNLSEGSAKFSKKEKKRYYGYAYGSTHEVITILSLCPFDTKELQSMYDILGAHIYKLIKSV